MKKLYYKIEMADGRELECSTTLQDFLLYEKTARRHGWPLVPSENMITWEAFLGWSALKRAGLYDGSFDAFRDTDAVNVDGQQEKPVRPTQPDPGADS